MKKPDQHRAKRQSRRDANRRRAPARALAAWQQFMAERRRNRFRKPRPRPIVGDSFAQLAAAMMRMGSTADEAARSLRTAGEVLNRARA